MKQEFKWCIKLDSVEAVDYANKYGLRPEYVVSEKYAHFPSYDGFRTMSKVIRRGYKELTLTQFKSQILNQSETLPQYWVVFNDGNPEFKKVVDYLFEKHGRRWEGNARNHFYGFDGNSCFKGTNWHCDIKNYQNNPVILTVEEFINLTTTKMEKEIEGYKLIKPEYKEAVKFIVNNLCFDFERLEKSIQNYEWPLQRLELAGVLHLWFEPVYKPENKVYTMGEAGNTFEVTVRDGKAFIGKADITESVKVIQFDLCLPYPTLVQGLWFDAHDIIVSIKGFWDQKANLSEWLAIRL